jgi:hypothetical protein
MSVALGTPLARDEGLVVEELGDEVLVYDLDADRAHCLGATASRVWRACDGASTVARIAIATGIDPADVERAVDELAGCALLAAPAPGMSRRDLGIRVMKGAMVAASVPLIVSIAAPAPAEAITDVAFCRQFTGNGCGQCHQNSPRCCCCEPSGGAAKDCVPSQAHCNALHGGVVTTCS